MDWSNDLEPHRNIIDPIILAVGDVEALYPIEDGLRALEMFLHRFPDEKYSVDFLLKIAELILTNNNMTFNGDFFKQVFGTAMWTKFSASYAIIYMAWIEEKYFSKLPDDLLPAFYRRFIDDIF